MGYWIHNGAALSKPEAASSLSVRLSMAIPCSSPPTYAVAFSSTSTSCSSNSGSGLGGLDSCNFFFLLKVLSKSPSKSEICSRTGCEI
ncbi:hypothetical protein ACFX2H_040229 [Malus domestica]